MKRFFAILLGMTAVAGAATVVQIPYTGGKQAGTVDIRTVSSSSPLIGTQSIISAVSFEVEDLFSVRFRVLGRQDFSSYCSNQEVALDKIFLQLSTAGTAQQLGDSSADWQSHSIRPPDSTLMALPLLSIAGDSGMSMGYRFASNGYCEGSSQTATKSWNRLIFVQNGSRYAKFAVTAKQDTSWGILPYYSLIKSIAMRYVVNDANELSDPVAIRPAQPVRRERGPSQVVVVHELYNPLGIRLRHGAGKYEPALPASRNSQNRQ